MTSLGLPHSLRRATLLVASYLRLYILRGNPARAQVRIAAQQTKCDLPGTELGASKDGLVERYRIDAASDGSTIARGYALVIVDHDSGGVELV
jgi:hypothetical protein